MSFFKKLRSTKQNIVAPNHNSTAAGILAVSKPILTFGPLELHSAPNPPESTIYRNTSDAAQTFLPPIQAVADIIPGVGGVIKGMIGGILSTLQIIDVIPSHHRVLLLALTLHHHRDTFRTRTT